MAFYGAKPDFNRAKQPYKNQNDERIRRLMAEGKGARLYDRWNANRVENVPKVKTGHRCRMPIQAMKSIIGILPDGIGAIDPFLGSGTTAAACAGPGVPFIGYETVEECAETAIERVRERRE